jgi:hypothetical protein
LRRTAAVSEEFAMYILIRLRNGNLVKAVVLAHTSSWMRVAAVGGDDAVELRLRGSDWVDERNEPVEFELTSLAGLGSRWQRMAENVPRQHCTWQQFHTQAGALSIC